MYSITPSLIAQAINGLLLVIAVIAILYYVYVKKAPFDVYTMIGLIILISIGVGIHGVLHFCREYMSQMKNNI